MYRKEPFATGKRPFATETRERSDKDRPGLFPMPPCPVCGSRGVIEGVSPRLSITFYSARCTECSYRYKFFRKKRSLTLARKIGWDDRE
ncbi:MAG: hypothetical protein VB016_04325 [Methanomassiliicoccaceae archaeon]|nr:hypothetical protein [Methanomassiliicoccaceae archaeon]